ncbi:DUF1569 domain-containing protein [bacterium]|nr:DUF1569 domain-containing protein [bacterium]
MTSIVQTLNKIDQLIPQRVIRNEQVSKWSVGMQIEHALLATNRICQALAKSEPYTGKIKKSFLRRMIFFTGVIPRGRGKSPPGAIPREQATEAELRELLISAHQAARKAAEAHGDNMWEHFLFGVLKKDDALRFVEIHNKHHLKIISDILSKQPQKNQ